MKIAGLVSSHDCSFVVLDNGKPIIHAELERYLRLKEPKGDAFEFLKNIYPFFKDIKYFCRPLDLWRGGPSVWYPNSTKEMNAISKNNGGGLVTIGHHRCHAANAFYSSNFDDALIITIDGGGLENIDSKNIVATMTIWEGKGNDIKPLRIFSEEEFNIGTVWSNCTEHIFGLSRGYPKGNQCGTVMAQACMGDGSKYYDYFWNHQFRHFGFNYDFFKSLAKRSEQEMFDIAASLQKATEDFVKIKLEPFIKNTKSKNLCLAGGVVLNSVLTGKMVENWYTDKFENFYTCPVPYDAGLSIGAAQYMWHNTLQQPRIHWENSFTPYLGVNYGIKDVNSALKEYDLNIENNIEIENITTLLAQQKIISVFNEGSESGRRALGNRSILADPRNPNMKNIINEKVKHRQWYRPFAPSILREKMPDWFEFDLDSPYMNYVLTFKDFAANKVPAVVHLDGTGRVQTVTKKDNAWFHQLLTEWNKVSGVPILLNTSFNDREPIVETPKNAIDCFLGTEIDYLYFCEHKILVSKK